jgi:TATA-binding protein-associated factor Taf7
MAGRALVPGFRLLVPVLREDETGRKDAEEEEAEEEAEEEEEDDEEEEGGRCRLLVSDLEWEVEVEYRTLRFREDRAWRGGR